MGWLLGGACCSDCVCAWQDNEIGAEARTRLVESLATNGTTQEARHDGGLGVGATYIVEDFIAEACTAAASAPVDPQFSMDATHPNFHYPKGVMAYGDAAKGRGLKCPRNGEEDCAIVE